MIFCSHKAMLPHTHVMCIVSADKTMKLTIFGIQYLPHKHNVRAMLLMDFAQNYIPFKIS